MNESKGGPVQIRRFPRKKVLLYYRPVSFSGEKCRISNLSLGGVKIYSDKLLKKGKRIEIEIFLPNERSIVTSTYVVWIETLIPDPNALYALGLEFIDLPLDALNELKIVLEKTATNI